jgi:hypothetical protein
MSLWSAVSQRVRSWFVARPASRIAFSTSGPIDALINGPWGQAYLDYAPISRDDAMTIAAVERGRDEICAAATLPLVARRGLDPVDNGFLDQPDPDVPKVVMLAQTLEDLLCDGVSWWMKTSLDYRGFPLAARRVVNVSLHPPGGDRSPAPLPSGLDPHGASVWVDGREVPAAWMIRFDSPGRPLLEAGRRSIRKAILFDALAAMYAQNPRPLETFTDTDNQTVTPYTDEEVEAFLAVYQQSRRRGGPAWIPKQAMRSDVSAPSPAELQLVELQREVSLEIALHMGLDPEDVGVNTTSRTYFNATDRRTDKINRTLGPYMSAITDRLSMGDVTPRGQVVRFDTTEWLRPDHAALASFLSTIKATGAIDAQEVRVAAGWSGAAPTPKPAPAPPAVDPAAAGQNMRVLPAQLGPALTAYALAGPGAHLAAAFDAGPGPVLHFSARDFAAATKPAVADVEKRTVTGLAVPYGAVARKYGVGFRFRPGSLEYDAGSLNRLRVMEGHSTYVGVHQKVEDTKDGPLVTLKILDGPEGSPTKMARDQLLMDAAGGLVDGLSVGVDFSLDPTDGDVEWSETEQVFDVVRATWNETSLTPDPAFTGARVTRVSASNSHGGQMNCQHCQRAHPQGMSCAVAAQLYPAQQQMTQGGAASIPVVMSATPPPPPAPPAGWPQVAPGGAWTAPVTAPAPSNQPLPAGQFAQQLPQGPVSAEQLTAALTGVVDQLVANGAVAAAPPVQQFATTVNPHAMSLPGPARVTEPEPYVLRFDRKGQGVMARGTHDFSSDFHQWFTNGDKGAHDRALAFVQKQMAAVFNVATTDINETNPTRQRPDMYVDQRQYRYPIWNAINKGALADITPFAFPKFNSASGLVGAHTEGTEPSTGSFTTTGQTITPTGYSGKARINREVWDQGGNPQVSTLIWNQMVRGVNEALEAAAVTELNAGSFTALGTLTAGATDRAEAGRVLGGQLQLGIAKLQFARGGYAFTDAFAQADLYEALAQAATTAGEPLYPMLGPSNRMGTSTDRFGSIVIAGQAFDPAWALAASGQTAATKSYLVDRSSVHGWASAPQRLTLDQVAVAYVDLGVWGYQATAVSDTAGVRTITWDPVA